MDENEKSERRRALRALRRVTNEGLGRVMVRKLWQAYDMGGISCGRSKRAVLLELFLDSLSQPRVEEKNYALWTWLDMEREAAKQKRVESKKNHTPRLFFTELCALPEQQFKCLVLRALCMWYRENENTEDDWSIAPQKKFFECIVRLYEVDETLKQLDKQNISFSFEQIRKEGEDRARARMLNNPEYYAPV